MKASSFYSLIFLFGLLIQANNTWSQDEKVIAHNKAAMRAIGHQLLLVSGDSSSRVMPILYDEGTYQIDFETQFHFEPGILVDIVDSVFTIQDISFNYLVEVLNCSNDLVTWSFEVGSYPQLENMACASREYPVDCYSIEITLYDQKREVIEQVAEANNEADSSSVFWILLTIGLILLVAIYLVLKNKKSTSAEQIMIGKYQFDKKKLKLYFEDQEIELTNKEADLLSLLYDSANNTLEREAILNVVWEDQGVYVGRTLDVFISKLRKKLEADATVKILNIRGVGYKLVLDA